MDNPGPLQPSRCRYCSNGLGAREKFEPAGSISILNYAASKAEKSRYISRGSALLQLEQFQCPAQMLQLACKKEAEEGTVFVSSTGVAIKEAEE